MSYITTVSGIHFYPLDPNPDDITDILNTFTPLRSIASPVPMKQSHGDIRWNSFSAVCCTTQARHIYAM